MIDKEFSEFRKKVREGLKESNQILLKATKKRGGNLVFSYDKKIVRIDSKSLPQNVSDISIEYK